MGGLSYKPWWPRLAGVICTSIRFMPKMKAKYDYGLVIFMLTFSLILVAGYRTEHDVTMAWVRLFVILVASMACMIISIAIFPAWVGTDLHNALVKNFDDLAFTIEGTCTLPIFNVLKQNKTNRPRQLWLFHFYGKRISFLEKERSWHLVLITAECASDFVKGALCQKDLETMNYQTTPRETIVAKFNAVIGSGASFDTMVTLLILISQSMVSWISWLSMLTWKVSIPFKSLTFLPVSAP